MKCNMPRSYSSLPEREKEAIRDYCQEEYTKQMDEAVNNIQRIWLKICCIILHEQFGFGKERCTRFIAAWKRKVKENRKFKDGNDQDEFYNEMLKFFKGEYPDEWIKKLEDV